MKRNAIRSLVVMMIAVMVFALTPVPVSAATKAPGKVKIKSVKVTAVSTLTNETTMVIKWKKAKRATGYYVYAKQGDGEWVKQYHGKKLPRTCRKLTLTDVPAGQWYIKVQAVNKKKKGKFSAVKTKYIESKQNVEQYSRYVTKPMGLSKVYGGIVSFSGNRVIVSYDVYDVFTDAADYNWSNPTSEVKTVLINYLNSNAHAKEMANQYKNHLNLWCGIRGASYTAKFVSRGTDIPGAYVTY